MAVRVLFVERPADDRQMYVEYLTIAGYEVVTCEDGSSALAAATEADVVVTGIRLDGAIDGIELLRQLRSNQATRRVPVIVLTACTLEPDQMRATDAGCDRFLAKPCLPETLADAVDHAVALSGRGRARPARAQAASARLRPARKR